MNTTIAEAIRDTKVLELRYHGYSRIVEPHAYGLDKDGNEVLRCFQSSGGSENGERVGWKFMKVRDVVPLHASNQTFTPRSEYRRNDKTMARIFIQI